MARARNIKPGLFKNEVLGVADPIYTLLFEGLWILADRDGKLEDRPLRIRGELFPYREGLDMESMLNWLQAQGFIRRYVANGAKCILVVEFVKHQNPHKNEAISELPDPIESKPEEIGTAPEFIGSAPADSLIPDSPIPDSLFSDSQAAPPSPPKQPKAKATEADEDFERAWSDYPQRPGASKADALKAWKARVNAGADVESMLIGVRRYAAYCLAQRIEPQFIKQAATFFGPGEHYLSDWSPPLPPNDTSDRDAEILRLMNKQRGEVIDV